MPTPRPCSCTMVTPGDVKRKGGVSLQKHHWENSIELKKINSVQKGKLNHLFYKFTCLGNKIGAWQNSVNGV